MKKGLKKFSKGMLAIFTIKLIILSVVMLIQACESSDDLEISKNKNNFLESIVDLQDDFSKINVQNRNKVTSGGFILQSRDSENLVNLNLTRLDSNQNLEVENFNDVVASINGGNLILNNELDSCGGKNNLCLLVDESKIINTLKPSIALAKDYLMSKGLSEQDIIEALNGRSESFLIPIVQSAISIENEKIAIYNNNNLNYLLGVQNANAQDWNEVGRCAAVAVGADLLYSFGASSATKWGTKALAKMIGKVALRFIGPAGVAVAVVTFSLCMNGWL